MFHSQLESHLPANPRQLFRFVASLCVGLCRNLGGGAVEREERLMVETQRDYCGDVDDFFYLSYDV